MFNPSYFERLIETVMLMVRHPEYPTKRQALAQCRDDVAELNRVGRLTIAEVKVLLEILDTGTPPAGRDAREGRPGEWCWPEPVGRGDLRVSARAARPF